MKKPAELRYIAYVRKSSEDKEKQELSHEGQINEIKKRFPDLNIIDWVIESKSAFKPGRPKFNSVMTRIENGEADGIVSYHPNRCSRNELDSARLTYALRTPGRLKGLRFCSFNFENTPEGIMLLQFTMNQGQYESSKQSREVRRGMLTKAATRGEMPGKVWPGYRKVPKLDDNGEPLMNTKENRIITETGIDPERYYVIEKMWKWFLQDRLTPSEIWKRVLEQCDYKTVPFMYRPTDEFPEGRVGGSGPMTKSMVYRIFRSPFYAGRFEHQGELCVGNHPKMISWEEYLLAQELLGAKANRRYTKFNHPYSGLIKCGECDCTIQARYNTKVIKGTGEVKTYVYYYCSRKSLARPCTQKVYTPLLNIEGDISEELAKYTIIPEFKELALKILQRNHKDEARHRGSVYEGLIKERTSLQAQSDKLLSEYLKENIEEERYRKINEQFSSKIKSIDEKLRTTERTAVDSTDLYEKAFDFAVNAKERFKAGDVRTKRDILRTLGQSITLKDNKLLIEPSEWLVPIGESYPALEKSYLRVRTNKKANSKELEKALSPIVETWRAQ